MATATDVEGGGSRDSEKPTEGVGLSHGSDHVTLDALGPVHFFRWLIMLSFRVNTLQHLGHGKGEGHGMIYKRKHGSHFLPNFIIQKPRIRHALAEKALLSRSCSNPLHSSKTSSDLRMGSVRGGHSHSRQRCVRNCMHPLLG